MCRKQPKDKDGINNVPIPFPTLEPGLKFITTFGVVEVVRDNRAMPVKEEEEEEPGQKQEEPGSEQNPLSVEELAASGNSRDNADADGNSKVTDASKNQTNADAMEIDDAKVQGNDTTKRGDPPASASALPANTKDTTAGKKKTRAHRLKVYRHAIVKRNAQLQRTRTAMSVLHLLRRKKFTRAYEKGQVNQQMVWKMQYGSDPRRIPLMYQKKFVEVRAVGMEDPSAPASSFPDRMVECKWVQDVRSRYVGIEDELPVLDKPPTLTDNRPNVFLRRRELTRPYEDGMVSFQCQYCAQSFLSKSGIQYHLTKVHKCSETNKAEAAAAVVDPTKDDSLEEPGDAATAISSASASTAASKRMDSLKAVDIRATDILARMDAKAAKNEAANISGSSALGSTATGDAVGVSERAKAEAPPFDKAQPIELPAAEFGDVSTGALLEPLARRSGIGSGEGPPRKKVKREPGSYLDQRPLAKTQKEIKAETEPKADPNFEDPRKVLRELEAEYRYLQSKHIGPVYPVVLSSLGFLKPYVKPKRKRRTKKQIAEDKKREEMEKKQIKQEAEERRLREEKEKTEAAKAAKAMRELEEKRETGYAEFLDSLKIRPPMIDTRVLVHEVDMGRYLSLGRHFANGTLKEEGLAQAKGDRAKAKDDGADEDNGEEKEVAAAKGHLARKVRPKPKLDPYKCFVCKTGGGTLEKCNFCPRSVHIACARVKYSLGDPEPFDDFLCPACIQWITQRRNRAERRRLEKVKGYHIPGTEVSATIAAPKQVPLHRNVVKGQEYEAVVSQGRHTANLVDLAAHARERLQHELDTSKLHEIRRQMMK